MPSEMLTSLEGYEQALSRHAAVLLFKHSPICPISDAALGRWKAFLAANPEVPTLFVDVIAARPVARGLAERCGVAHASPQAIAFQNGRPVWNASHDAITAESLAAAWTAVQTDAG